MGFLANTSYVSNSPLSFVDPGGQFQAGIGCNVGYVMCMNGGNTSGGGSSQGSETATIRTYQTHTVHVVDWEPSPTWNPGGGGIYGRGGIFGGGDINNGTHGDIYGGIFGNVWGGHETIQYTPFVTTFSFDYWATETRQIQNPAEERSPASKPMDLALVAADIGGSLFIPGYDLYQCNVANNCTGWDWVIGVGGVAISATGIGYFGGIALKGAIKASKVAKGAEELSKSQLRGIKSLEKQIQRHQQKTG